MTVITITNIKSLTYYGGCGATYHSKLDHFMSVLEIHVIESDLL